MTYPNLGPWLQYMGEICSKLFEHQKIVKTPGFVDICEDCPCTTALENSLDPRPHPLMRDMGLVLFEQFWGFADLACIGQLMVL